jgi:hypothetical protein
MMLAWKENAMKFTRKTIKEVVREIRDLNYHYHNPIPGAYYPTNSVEEVYQKDYAERDL